MAGTWKINVSNTDVDEKRSDVSFIRTDSDSAIAIRTYSFKSTIIGTAQERNAIFASVKAKDVAAVAELDDITVFFEGLTANGEVALDAWELTR